MRLSPPPPPPLPASYLEFERVFRPMFVVLWRPILEREGGSNSHGTDRGGEGGKKRRRGKRRKSDTVVGRSFVLPILERRHPPAHSRKGVSKKTFRGSLFKYLRESFSIPSLFLPFFSPVITPLSSYGFSSLPSGYGHTSSPPPSYLLLKSLHLHPPLSPSPSPPYMGYQKGSINSV